MGVSPSSFPHSTPWCSINKPALTICIVNSLRHHLCRDTNRRLLMLSSFTYSLYSSLFPLFYVLRCIDFLSLLLIILFHSLAHLVIMDLVLCVYSVHHFLFYDYSFIVSGLCLWFSYCWLCLLNPYASHMAISLFISIMPFSCFCPFVLFFLFNKCKKGEA